MPRVPARRRMRAYGRRMESSRASALADIRVLPTAQSTFDAVEPDAPDWTTWVTLDQRAGHGRLDRSWQTPPGEALAACVIARPSVGVTWTPLAVGLAMTRTLTPLIDGSASLKWPNDVLIGDRKVSGILCRMQGDAIVMGFGVNLVQQSADLLPTAVSLRLAGAKGDAAALADAVLAGMLEQLRQLVPRLDSIASEVEAVCSTIGQRVRAELPSGDSLIGTAVRLDADGALVIETGHAERAVTAGDIVHLRRA